jgi:hypothetical protein
MARAMGEAIQASFIAALSSSTLTIALYQYDGGAILNVVVGQCATILQICIGAVQLEITKKN